MVAVTGFRREKERKRRENRKRKKAEKGIIILIERQRTEREE